MPSLFPRLVLSMVLLSGSVTLITASTPLVSVPRFTHPGAGQVLYFVLTDRFANGDPANDTGGIPGGPEAHGFDPTLKSHYQGGDLAGLLAQLDYIQGLGTTAIWLTPPFRNKPMQQGTAGYHGYWILDFLSVDPHLGTNAEFRAFVDAAHARGIKVYMDIIVNHTADVIQYAGDDFSYRSIASAPDRDPAGEWFDPRSVAYNGIDGLIKFPEFDATRSFARSPVVPVAEIAAKNPAWLNDVTFYHNRGNTTFAGENSLFGDFVGLDDLYTENPRVVQGFIEIYQQWIDTLGIDGFRIDTAKHVNLEFWQAFSPAIRAHTRARGRSDFLSFGEVMTEAKDVELLSAFSTTANLDTTIDFAFLTGARDFVSKGGDAAALARLFALDDLYTDHDSNVHSTVTCLGNHDLGRFAWFLEQDNPGADDAQLLALDRLGHALLFLVRGQPTVYYGDEQGMLGTGNDQAARESMFASRTPLYHDARLLGTTRTGADDKFDTTHPLYRTIRELATLRAAHPALVHGAMLVRDSGNSQVFAFSRIERSEHVEYLIALNSSRSTRMEVSLPTSQPAGATLRRVLDSRDSAAADLTVGFDRRVTLSLEPLQYAVWRADAALPSPAVAPRIALVAPMPHTKTRFASRMIDGQFIPLGQELSVAVDGSDGLAEVTFVLERQSRPGQYEVLGVDDAPPYRVFWRPAMDVRLGETFALIATVDDRRGHRMSTRVDGLEIDTGGMEFGINGAAVPWLSETPPAMVTMETSKPFTLVVGAGGTAPLEYQWLRNGRVIPDGIESTLSVFGPGTYAVMVRNRAGTVVSAETVVTVAVEH